MICESHPDTSPSAAGGSSSERMRQVNSAGSRSILAYRDAAGSDRWLESSLLGEIRSLHGVIRHLERELEISRQKEIRASYDAQHDALTGLPNRLLLECWLDHALGTSSSDVRCVAMFIDMDRFKTVNDSYGHQVGDHLLKAAALRIRETIGERSLVARYAGDEFVVLLPGQACLAAARSLAEQLVQSLCRPFDLGGLVIEVGASVGVAVAPPFGIQKQVFLHQADTALYAAKACGGSNVQVFQLPGADDSRRAG